MMVVCDARSADGSSRVARRGLNPELLEDAAPMQLAVGYAIQGNAAREAEIALARLVLHVAGHAQHDLLGDFLDRTRQVHLALRERRLRHSRGSAKQLLEAPPGHAQAGAVIEVLHVHAERAVGFQIQQSIVDDLRIARLAVGREAHQFVFAGINFEPGIVGKRRIKQSQ